MDTTLAQGRRDALLAELIAWFTAEARDLPWRRTRDPYEVLVSEVMLQQTQATRVVPAWTAFLDRFPTVVELAAAPTAEVVQHWQGLGYNRRAVNLQRMARTVVERHDGVMPSTLDELLALPGVGPYTARAVLVFAHERAAAPVDVNVARVVQRAVAGTSVPPRERQRLAEALVTAPDAGGPWMIAQALIELGARHCTARAPSCGACPIAPACAWRAAGHPPPDPGASTRSPQKPFAGSDRYHRGRLLDALRAGQIDVADIPAAAATSDTDRAARVADGLVADGLAEWSHATLTLPERFGGSP